MKISTMVTFSPLQLFHADFFASFQPDVLALRSAPGKPSLPPTSIACWERRQAFVAVRQPDMNIIGISGCPLHWAAQCQFPKEIAGFLKG